MSRPNGVEERKEQTARLVNTEGWEALKEEIQSQISIATKNLATQNFNDLRQVDKLQQEVYVLNRVIKFVED